MIEPSRVLAPERRLIRPGRGDRLVKGDRALRLLDEYQAEVQAREDARRVLLAEYEAEVRRRTILAIGISIGIGCSRGTGPPIPTPLSIAPGQTQAWWNADYGITFAGYLSRTTGTGTATMGISGSPSVRAGILLQVEVGATTYKYSADGGATFIETGKTIPVGGGNYTAIGALAGVILVFPSSGTYVAGDVHQGIVAGWIDQIGNGHDLTQVSAAASPVYEYSGFNSRASLLFDGSNDALKNTTLPSSFSGTDVPIWMVFAAQVLTSSTKDLFSFGANSATANLYELSYVTTPTWQFAKIDGAPTTKSTSGGTANLSRHLFVTRYSGTTQQLRVDGADVTLSSSGDLDLVASTVDRFAIGCRCRNTDTLFCNMRIREMVVGTGTLTTPQVTAFETYFAGTSPL